MPETIDPFKLPFDEAIAYFKQKSILPSLAWDDFADAAADYAFTLANVTSLELLGDVYRLVASGLENGDSYGEFKKGFDHAIDKAGWNPAKRPWRTALIFNQNLRNAYGAGRYKQMSDPEVLRLRPYWQWVHRDSRVPRPHHLALDQKVFRADAPFWQTCFPPSGFGCRCGAVSVSRRDIEREGLTVDEPPQETVTVVDKVTGDKKRVPAIGGKPIGEPGFSTIPGGSDPSQKQAILEQAMQKLPPQLREQVKRALEK
ncbi:phage head morphogenesis protein [Nostoc linckia]|uniref:phage head morphogenesis protein n=1 Tax=Nostoc linckia TaxID=92942 RepID=UPI000BFFFDD1|nr:phage minor head protein [Nostoc linckia]